MTEEVRYEQFCNRAQLPGLSAASMRRIWSEGELNQFQKPRRGKQKLSDNAINEIFSDACVRHSLGVSFSPRTLKLRIIEDGNAFQTHWSSIFSVSKFS